MEIIVTGTLALDHIMDFPGLFADRIMPDAIHKLSLSFLVDKLSRQYGGTAGNIAYTLSLLGARPHLVSVAGSDFADYQKHLARHKVSTRNVKVVQDEPTSSFFVVTDQGHNQIGAFYVGPSKYTSKLSLKKNVKSEKSKPFVILAPTVPEAMNKFARECRESGFPYLYDPAFQIGVLEPADLRDGIAHAEILIANDYEMKLLEEKLELTHEELRVLVPVVITTLGSRGAIIETRRESIHIKPAVPSTVLDPTGAGDAFRAGFVCGYSRHMPLDICGQMGALAAVYTVEKYGTQTHIFDRRSFAKRYEKNYGTKLKF